jgi:hypothetical protein
VREGVSIADGYEIDAWICTHIGWHWNEEKAHPVATDGTGEVD